MVRQSIFRRQNRADEADEETPLLAAEITVDPVRNNIGNTVNRGRTPAAFAINIEDDTTSLLGRGSVRDDSPERRGIIPRGLDYAAGRASQGLSNTADKVQHYTAGLNSAVINSTEFINNHAPRYRENDDSVMNGFRGIGRGMSRVLTGSVVAASVPVTLVGTGISEGLKAVSGVSRREVFGRVDSGEEEGELETFSDRSLNNLTGTAASLVSGTVNIARGALDVMHGTADVTGGIIGNGTKSLGRFSARQAADLRMESDWNDATNENQSYRENFKNIGLGIKQLFAGSAVAVAGTVAAAVGTPARIIKKTLGQKWDENANRERVQRNTAARAREMYINGGMPPHRIFITTREDRQLGYKPYMDDFGIASGLRGSYGGVRTMFSGVKNVIKGTGGLARSVWHTSTKDFAEGFRNSFDKKARENLGKRLGGIPVGVNVEGDIWHKLGFGSMSEAYTGITNIHRAIESLGKLRNTGGQSAAYDVAGFIR